MRHNFPWLTIGWIHSAGTLCAAAEDDATVNIYNFQELGTEQLESNATAASTFVPGGKLRSRGGRPKVALEIRQLIRAMSLADPLWGAPGIHGERWADLGRQIYGKA